MEKKEEKNTSVLIVRIAICVLVIIIILCLFLLIKNSRKEEGKQTAYIDPSAEYLQPSPTPYTLNGITYNGNGTITYESEHTDMKITVQDEDVSPGNLDGNADVGAYDPFDQSDYVSEMRKCAHEASDGTKYNYAALLTLAIKDSSWGTNPLCIYHNLYMLPADDKDNGIIQTVYELDSTGHEIASEVSFKIFNSNTDCMKEMGEILYKQGIDSSLSVLETAKKLLEAGYMTDAEFNSFYFDMSIYARE